jgi:uncharacterized membrane protein YcjF (UPF0283 family)
MKVVGVIVSFAVVLWLTTYAVGEFEQAQRLGVLGPSIYVTFLVTMMAGAAIVAAWSFYRGRRPWFLEGPVRMSTYNSVISNW